MIFPTTSDANERQKISRRIISHGYLMPITRYSYLKRITYAHKATVQLYRNKIEFANWLLVILVACKIRFQSFYLAYSLRTAFLSESSLICVIYVFKEVVFYIFSSVFSLAIKSTLIFNLGFNAKLPCSNFIWF